MAGRHWPFSNAVTHRHGVFSPRLPAALRRLRQHPQRQHTGQELLPMGSMCAEAEAHFAFEFVRDTACGFLSTQCSPPPLLGLSDQLIVL